MPGSVSRFSLERLTERPLARLIAYYVLLVAGTAILVQVFPNLGHSFSSERMEDLGRFGGRHGDLSALVQPPDSVPGTGPVDPALAAAFAMVGATLLMLPVAWVYVLTRQKKGYRQSIVQTLVILPAVVAGVVILVKNSLALAFSLAGIVAAVNFRSTLRDTKDAVFVFLAMVIGLAAGVQIMTVALAVSVMFNALVLVLAWSDFGRAPAALEGTRARARLQRARAAANRTGMFVSVLDREILKSMSPEQLDALAERARRLRGRTGPGEGAGNDKPLDTTLRVFAVAPEAVRGALEAILATQVKAWRFDRTVEGTDGTHGLEYKVRLRKKVSADDLLAQLRDRGGPGVRAEIT